MLISASPGSPDVDSYRNDSPRGPDSTFQTPALGTVYSKASSRFTLHSWPRQGIPKVMLTLASWRAGSLVACGGQVSPDLCPLPPVLGTCLEASTPAWLTSSTRPGWRPWPQWHRQWAHTVGGMRTKLPFVPWAYHWASHLEATQASNSGF
jgi:hypothetical protein